MAKLPIVVCLACGAKWYLGNWHDKCPSCGHAEGKKEQVEEAELAG